MKPGWGGGGRRPLTPGQQHVSQGDVVQQEAGHAQRQHHQPAHERHGPVKRAADTNTPDHSRSDRPVTLPPHTAGAGGSHTSHAFPNGSSILICVLTLINSMQNMLFNGARRNALHNNITTQQRYNR